MYNPSGINTKDEKYHKKETLKLFSKHIAGDSAGNIILKLFYMYSDVEISGMAERRCRFKN